MGYDLGWVRTGAQTLAADSRAALAFNQDGSLKVGGASGGSVPVGASALSAGVDRSGTATTSSGGLTVPANSNRTALVGQNVGANNIGFNEFGGTAAIGSAGTFTVAPGQSFSISTRNAVNFIAATGNTAVTMTEVSG